MLHSALVSVVRMIRRPSRRSDLYAWYRAALELKGDHDSLLQVRREAYEALPRVGLEPQCGFYKTRLVRGGPFVPARIFMRQLVDADGDLVDDEKMVCQIGPDFYDPEDQFPMLCVRPIAQAEYEYLMALHHWAVAYAPGEPHANQSQPIDWLAVPAPTFEKARNGKRTSRRRS